MTASPDSGARAGETGPRERARPGSARAATALRLAVIAAALAVCAATSAPRYPRNFPMWRTIDTAERQVGCAGVRAFVSKSGKTGVGLSLAVRGGIAPCRVEVTAARLAIAGADAVQARSRGEAVEVAPGQLAFAYVTFAFDNNALWNQGARAGAFALEVAAGGQTARWRVAAEHRLDGWHVDRHARREVHVAR